MKNMNLTLYTQNNKRNKIIILLYYTIIKLTIIKYGNKEFDIISAPRRHESCLCSA